MDMDQHICQFFHQDLSKHHEMIIDKDAWEISVAQTPESGVRKILYENRSHLFFHFT